MRGPGAPGQLQDGVRTSRVPLRGSSLSMSLSAHSVFGELDSPPLAASQDRLDRILGGGGRIASASLRAVRIPMGLPL